MRRVTILAYALLALGFAAPAARAQAPVPFTVALKECDETPVADAAVSLLDDVRTPTEKEGGLYEFSLEPGPYTVKVEAAGFTTVTRAVNVPADGGTEPIVVDGVPKAA